MDVNELIKYAVGTVLGGGVVALVTQLLQRKKIQAEAQEAIASSRETEARTGSIEADTVAKLWRALSSLQNEVSDLRSTIASLQAENSVLKSENYSLQGKIVTLDVEKEELKKKVAALCQENADMAVLVTDLTARVKSHEEMARKAGKALSDIQDGG